MTSLEFRVTVKVERDADLKTARRLKFRLTRRKVGLEAKVEGG
jgi:hypothetical protein